MDHDVVRLMLRSFIVLDPHLVNSIRENPRYTKMSPEEILGKFVSGRMMIKEARYVDDAQNGPMPIHEPQTVALKAISSRETLPSKVAQVEAVGLNEEEMALITDNDTQFTGRKFLDFCEDHHIRVDWATVAHHMTNGQVEHANDMILQGLKPRIYNNLHKFGRRWMKELPLVVWSLRTTPSRATGFTPFFLVYGAEAILPTDLKYGSPRTRAYDDRRNQTNREDSLDQLEEARDMALLHSARYQQSLRRYHARWVWSRDLQVGDLVLRLRQDARGRHKLTPPWEGPFIIAKILKLGTYKLANSQGEVYNNAWNIRQLRRFYP
jgi:hypothetical protein